MSMSVFGGFFFLAIILIICIPLLTLILRIIAALIVANTVIKKGYTLSETHAFAKCFFFGIAGYCYVIALPDRNVQNTEAHIATTADRIEENQRILS